MKTFIYPPVVNYSILYQRPQQILRALSRAGHETYFVNSETGSREGEYVCTEITEEEDNFFILPFNSEVEKKIDIFYLTYPLFLKTWAQQIKHNNLWFDSIDLPDAEFAHWEFDFYESLESSDFVTASSSVLYDIAREHNPNVAMVRNGVEYNHFQQKNENPYPYDKPIVGFGGAIASWVDLDLIYECVKTYPEYMFIILGIRYNTDLIEEYKMPKNLKFIGHKNYFDLPKYYQHLDVCTIPFKDSDMTQAANPLKFWEYMATGNPVVTSNLTETKYKGVHWSKDRDEYIDNIGKAVEEKINGNKGADTRKQIAKNADWNKRIKPILDYAEEL